MLKTVERPSWDSPGTTILLEAGEEYDPPYLYSQALLLNHDAVIVDCIDNVNTKDVLNA